MPGPADHVLALPPGYVLESYRILKVLGSGGFGITYLAIETESHKQVAIKELLPNDIATRVAGSTVKAKATHLVEAFEVALDGFMKEARALARLAHPNIVLIHRLFRANGTAYMVMDYVEGQSLNQWLLQHPRPTEADLRGILMPLLSGLEHVHGRGLLHRDIKPENIYITTDGRPLLLDFGSARVEVGNSQPMTAVVSEGYSPYEQYQRTVRQTPAADLYSLAAVMVRAVTGRRPDTAIDRAVDGQTQKPVSQTHSGRFSRKFLAALDAAFAVNAANRPQTVGQWRDMLEGQGGRDGPATGSGSWLPWAASALLLAGVSAIIFMAMGWGGGGATANPSVSTGGGSSSSTPAVDPPSSGQPQGGAPPQGTTPPEGGGGTTPPGGGGGVNTMVPKPPDAPVQTLPPVIDPPAPPKRIAATKDAPFVNSLQQEYIPVPGISGLLMGRTEVRVSDFRAFVKDTAYVQRGGVWVPALKPHPTGGELLEWRLDPKASWDNPGFAQAEDHPVVGVNIDMARAFAAWLSKKEGRTYRLPSDAEWSAAAGSTLYPWGTAWPAPAQSGNYAGTEWRRGLPGFVEGWMVAYERDDGFSRTAPVGRFAANANGFFDLGGNVWELCEERYRATLNSVDLLDESPKLRDELDDQGRPMTVARGGAWSSSAANSMRTSLRAAMPASRADDDIGFRCVLVLP